MEATDAQTKSSVSTVIKNAFRRLFAIPEIGVSDPPGCCSSPSSMS